MLYTDGVTECSDADEVEFGTDRLIAIMRRSKSLSASALLEEIVNELMAFGGQQQQDDITLVIAKRHRDL